MSFQQQPTASERIKFDTQKPEKLLERIIKSSIDINKNGIVLDYYGGSGTTSNTAQKLGVKHITIEMGDHFYSVIIPRIKRTLIGQDTDVSRTNNYRGGGFIKYYELEQYEDVLRKAKYNDKDDLTLTMYNSERLLDCIKIRNGITRIDFNELYPDIDVAETISNITGKKIRKINNERVIFEDNTEIKFNDIQWEKNKNLRPLFWWGEANE